MSPATIRAFIIPHPPQKNPKGCCSFFFAIAKSTTKALIKPPSQNNTCYREGCKYTTTNKCDYTNDFIGIPRIVYLMLFGLSIIYLFSQNT